MQSLFSVSEIKSVVQINVPEDNLTTREKYYKSIGKYLRFS